MTNSITHTRQGTVAIAHPLSVEPERVRCTEVTRTLEYTDAVLVYAGLRDYTHVARIIPRARAVARDLMP